MPETLTDRIDAKVAALEAEIDRLIANCNAEVARLQETQRTLLAAKTKFTPDRESAMNVLKREGLI